MEKNLFMNEKNIYVPKIYGGIGEKESKDLLDTFFKKLEKSYEPISFL